RKPNSSTDMTTTLDNLLSKVGGTEGILHGLGDVAKDVAKALDESGKKGAQAVGDGAKEAATATADGAHAASEQLGNLAKVIGGVLVDKLGGDHAPPPAQGFEKAPEPVVDDVEEAVVKKVVHGDTDDKKKKAH
ncbi:hypothetical protein PENTCL1PPCAC_8208, partial [Pristionchus entomophagus]